MRFSSVEERNSFPLSMFRFENTKLHIMSIQTELHNEYPEYIELEIMHDISRLLEGGSHDGTPLNSSACFHISWL